MAALALIVGTSITAGFELAAQDRNPTDQTAQSRDPKPAEAQATNGTRVSRRIRASRAAKLNLVIAGLGREGCDVEIKPGNPSCKFRALNEKGAEGRQHVTSAGKATLDLLDIELRGADRTCSVAITVAPARTTRQNNLPRFPTVRPSRSGRETGREDSGRTYVYLLSQLPIEGHQSRRHGLQHPEMKPGLFRRSGILA